MTTKILALRDALGDLVRLVLLPGHRFGTVGVPPLIAGIGFDALLADRAFDTNATLAELDARVAKAVIARHPRRSIARAIDEEVTSGATKSRTSAAGSRTSTASPCAAKRPARASLR
jgi:hypothetical protein